MAARSRVGPFSHLRPGARLESDAHVGNFGEVKNATIGAGVQMHHFSYIGDANVGAGTNIGAGVVTVNYDGKQRVPHPVLCGWLVGPPCSQLPRLDALAPWMIACLPVIPHLPKPRL